MSLALTSNLASADEERKLGLADVSEHMGDEIRWSWEFITPERARELQALPKAFSRRIRPGHASAIAQDMVSGNFIANGTPISIGYTRDGKYPALHDGNHRLDAVRRAKFSADAAGKEFEGVYMWVMYNQPYKAVDNIDTGAKRGFHDLLKDREYECYVPLAAVTRAMAKWEQGVRVQRGKARIYLTNNLLLAYLKDHPALLESAKLGHRVYRESDELATPAVLAHVHYMCSLKDPELADKYLTALQSRGVRLRISQAENARNLIMKEEARGNALTATEKFAILVFGWNLLRDGDHISLIKVPWSYQKSGKRVLAAKYVPEPR